MRLISKLSALAAGLCLSVAPAMAKVDAGTPALLQTLPRYGVDVALNPSECQGQSRFHGYYHTGTKDFVVCYNGVPNANDHDTVRHESMHVAQHCASQRDGHPYGIRPILSGDRLNEFVTSVLTPDEITKIKSAYPREKWLTELEAFAGAKLYTAAQIQHIVNQWCSI